MCLLTVTGDKTKHSSHYRQVFALPAFELVHESCPIAECGFADLFSSLAAVPPLLAMADLHTGVKVQRVKVRLKRLLAPRCHAPPLSIKSFKPFVPILNRRCLMTVTNSLNEPEHESSRSH